MKACEKVEVLEELLYQDEFFTPMNAETVADALALCELEVYDYPRYLCTSPIQVKTELMRLKNADKTLCAALITMLVREDHFDPGAFTVRRNDGSAKRVLRRLISFLREEAGMPEYREMESPAFPRFHR
ncbi:MAG: hypothetical protein IKT43_01170 [Clostridia bacterium]|nr:hypothetical protein [Clostridia bacterium]